MEDSNILYFFELINYLPSMCGSLKSYRHLLKSIKIVQSLLDE